MTQQEKQQITDSVQQYVDKYGSQNKAVQSLTGISAATLSQLLKGKWDNISDEMWRNVGAQVGWSKYEGWTIVQTAAYQEMTFAMDDAKRWKNVTWVVGDAGCGKTTSAKLFSEQNRESFYLLCSEDMKKSDFVREIARRIGLRTSGYSIRELLDRIIESVVQMDSPLLIFDEADKLPERVFHYFIDLYNRLEDKCGIVFFSTSYIKRRMQMGLRYNKCGYNEIHSRIGRKFFDVEATTSRDVFIVCTANGLNEQQTHEVVKDAEAYEFDLRRVKKAVHRAKRMSK